MKAADEALDARTAEPPYARAFFSLLAELDVRPAGMLPAGKGQMLRPLASAIAR